MDRGIVDLFLSFYHAMQRCKVWFLRGLDHGIWVSNINENGVTN